MDDGSLTCSVVDDRPVGFGHMLLCLVRNKKLFCLLLVFAVNLKETWNLLSCCSRSWMLTKLMTIRWDRYLSLSASSQASGKHVVVKQQVLTIHLSDDA